MTQQTASILLSCLPAVGIGLTWIAYQIRYAVNRFKIRKMVR
jgi:hypothetical protein